MGNENSKDIILEGAVGIFKKIDLSNASGDTSILIPFDSDLASLGFRLIGDLMCSALSGFLRCYIQPHHYISAILLIGIKDGKLAVFDLLFESNFSGDVSLTTSTSQAMKDMPEVGIHRRVHAWENVYDLYEKHHNYMKEIKARYGDAQPIGDTLLSVAESIDSVTVRMSNLTHKLF
jgi:hypothetical protein